MLFVLIYAYKYLTCQMIFVYTVPQIATNGAGSTNLFVIFEFITVAYGVRVSQSSVLCTFKNESKELISTFHLYISLYSIFQSW